MPQVNHANPAYLRPLPAANLAKAEAERPVAFDLAVNVGKFGAALGAVVGPVAGQFLGGGMGAGGLGGPLGGILQSAMGGAMGGNSTLSQMQLLQLQEQMNLRAQVFQTLSNIMKAEHESKMNSVRNIKP